MRFLAFALVCAATLLPSAVWATQEEDDAERIYMFCVRGAAVRFEASGESPTDIAQAAMWACLPQYVAASNLLQNDPQAPISSNGLEATAKQAAIGQVVGVRLCKKTNDCAYSVAK
jgi:hypothetical protein